MIAFRAMTPEALERIETKIAFLEGANAELSDVVYRQRQEIDELKARLVALGARRVERDYPEGADHVVLADPDGNLFCVVA